MTLDKRLDALEAQAGRPVMAYSGAWIEHMNAASGGVASTVQRYDVPPPPLIDGEPDPALVYVPAQHGLDAPMGWTRKDALQRHPLIDAMIFTPTGPEEL